MNSSQYLSAIDQFGGDSSTLNFGYNTDWQDVILRTAPATTNNLSYSKGYEKVILGQHLVIRINKVLLKNQDVKESLED